MSILIIEPSSRQVEEWLKVSLTLYSACSGVTTPPKNWGVSLFNWHQYTLEIEDNALFLYSGIEDIILLQEQCKQALIDLSESDVKLEGIGDVLRHLNCNRPCESSHDTLTLGVSTASCERS